MSFVLDRTTVLLPIHPAYVAKIHDGTKLWEFRRRPLPGDVETVLIWRTGGHLGGISGRFLIAEQRVQPAGDWVRDLDDDAPVPGGGIIVENLLRYAGGRDALLCGIRVVGVERLPRLMPGTWLHPSFTRAPQAFRYAPAGWRELYLDAASRSAA